MQKPASVQCGHDYIQAVVNKYLSVQRILWFSPWCIQNKHGLFETNGIVHLKQAQGNKQVNLKMAIGFCRRFTNTDFQSQSVCQGLSSPYYSSTFSQINCQMLLEETGKRISKAS